MSKVWFITGAGRGLGIDIAQKALAAGHSVVATGRNADRVLQAVGAHDNLLTVALDITDPEAAITAAKAAVDRFGRIDILVNNAGITRDQLLLRMKQDDWDEVMKTNLTGAFLCAQAVIRPMIRQRGGRIVSVGSVVGQAGNAGQANYAASKAGLIGFSKALAREVASRGITVNVVAPGLIDTEMTRAISEKAHGDWAAQIPLGRLGATTDVAAAVCFLVSDEASYITGQVLAVNGGMYM
jgi:3-oxoacyl-[acyl-carrier protein] reductase